MRANPNITGSPTPLVPLDEPAVVIRIPQVPIINYVSETVKHNKLLFSFTMQSYSATWLSSLSTVQTRERVRVPHSMTGTLSSVHISGTISTMIGSITAHCSGGDVQYDSFCRIYFLTDN